MARFNENSRGTNITTNHEGEKAYRLSPELELYSLVVSSLLSDSFYEGSDSRLGRLRGLIKKVSPEFVAKLSVYAREKMYLRTLPIVLVVELARIHNGDDLVRRAIRRVIQRPDEITEALSYYQIANGRNLHDPKEKSLNKLSNALQLGISDAFNKFDEYQFAKYNRKGVVELIDALRLTHPKPETSEKESLFNKIKQRTLTTPYTWETQLSSVGEKKFETKEEKDEAFKLKWEELIDSGKLGYMALLRNLRNIVQSGVSDAHLIKVAQRISDNNEVRKAKQFPFRFLSAYRELKEIKFGKMSILFDALEDAIRASAENMKGFGYDTAVTIACDVSGSMQTPISYRSKVQNYDVGLILGMLLASKCKNVEVGMFGDIWKVISVPTSQVLRNADEFHKREGEVGYSTNGWAVIQDLRNRKIQMDKIMIFTDCQMWDSGWGEKHIQDEWKEYKKDIAPEAKLYLFDLSGYGDVPLNVQNGDVFLISGWSDKVFEMLDAYENKSNAVKEITSIEI